MPFPFYDVPHPSDYWVDLHRIDSIEIARSTISEGNHDAAGNYTGGAVQAILYRVVRRWRYREKIGESGMSFDSNDSGAEIDEFFVDVEVYEIYEVKYGEISLLHTFNLNYN